MIFDNGGSTRPLKVFNRLTYYVLYKNLITERTDHKLLFMK